MAIRELYLGHRNPWRSEHYTSGIVTHSDQRVIPAKKPMAIRALYLGDCNPYRSESYTCIEAHGDQNVIPRGE